MKQYSLGDKIIVGDHELTHHLLCKEAALTRIYLGQLSVLCKR
jgi:hypothetical protein